MVFALCIMLLRDRPDAEDALQQTFLSAHRSMLTGTVPDDPPAWLATIARNECISRLRRRRLEKPLRETDHPAGSDVAELADQRAEIAALSEALAALPATQRQAVILRDFYGLSYRDVSVALGVSGPAVESLLFRSRRRLQEALRPIHAASGLTALPLAVREALVRAVPGFSNGLTATGAGLAGAGVSAKIVSLPAVAKLAALAVVAGVGVTVAQKDAPRRAHVATNAAAPMTLPATSSPTATAHLQRSETPPPPSPAPPAATGEPAAHGVRPAAALVATTETGTVAASTPEFLTATRTSSRDAPQEAARAPTTTTSRLPARRAPDEPAPGAPTTTAREPSVPSATSGLPPSTTTQPGITAPEPTTARTTTTASSTTTATTTTPTTTSDGPGPGRGSTGYYGPSGGTTTNTSTNSSTTGMDRRSGGGYVMGYEASRSFDGWGGNNEATTEPTTTAAASTEATTTTDTTTAQTTTTTTNTSTTTTTNTTTTTTTTDTTSTDGRSPGWDGTRYSARAVFGS